MERIESIDVKIRELLESSGFEVYPFKVGWYNAKVDRVFHLSYPDDTLAYVILSTPAMFDNAFKPYVAQHQCDGLRDPIDQCMVHHFDMVKQAVGEENMICIHDFDMYHNRRPKVLMQTVGSIAGAARFYQRSDVQNPAWNESKKIFGVSMHPRYGGWFAFRAVLIFPDVLHPTLKQKEPLDVVPDNERRIILLELFNGDWRSGAFRDVIDVEERYSADQHDYFTTPPKNRLQYISRFCSN